ncbi:MAG: nitroreductase family protein, partial [Bacteroidetes bacterium]|nr:nitroreductase family protein [Bacteroidota bacterium]
MKDNSFIPLAFKKLEEQEIRERALNFYENIKSRRSVRHFSEQSIPKEVIEHIILSAGTAPSGAHKQPWTFCAVSNKELKDKIRKAAEEEEYLNYTKRMSEQWLKDLEPFNTNWEKPMLSDAPWLIIVFRKAFDLVEGEKIKNYYINESVGIACGFLLAAIHEAGLVSLTHTPSPMQFLCEILNRPSNEKAYLLIPVGYPADKCEVPKLD